MLLYSVEELSGDVYTEVLKRRKQEFDLRFEDTFGLSERGEDYIVLIDWIR